MKPPPEEGLPPIDKGAKVSIEIDVVVITNLMPRLGALVNQHPEKAKMFGSDWRAFKHAVKKALKP